MNARAALARGAKAIWIERPGLSEPSLGLARDDSATSLARWEDDGGAPGAQRE